MDHDVVISGGGPVGLMLACELRLSGVDVVVLERLTEPDLTIKAGSINLPTAEAFYRRGMLPALAEQQRAVFEQMRAFAGSGHRPPFIGHFAGIMVGAEGVDVEDPAFRDAGPAIGVMLVPQQGVEAVLAERAAAAGVVVRRGVEVTGVDADGDGVTVATSQGPVRAGWLVVRRGVEVTGVDADGDGVTVATSQGPVRAGWLVGCDGGRSPVRRLVGFDFPGTDPEITGRQAVVEMTGAEELRPGWNHTDTGVYVHGPVPGRVLTVEFDGPPPDRDAPITAAELQTSIRNVSGVDVTVTAVRSATRYTDNARQAATYRMGRVLLAGDAAHVHSPFGGQGLNLGIGDAVNLGWKLAATVQGRAPEGLLDTYTTERHPVGEWVLEWTRAQVALMRPDRRARALRGVVRDLLATGDGATHLATKLSGVLHRAGSGDHPLVGTVAADLAFADGTRLGEHGPDGRPLLLDLADTADLRDVAAAWGERVAVLTTKTDSPLTGLLLRPDGHIAWAREDGTADGLASALRSLALPLPPVPTSGTFVA